MALSKPTGKLAFAYQSIAILEAARKQDDALIRQLVAALEGYRRNHNDAQPCDAEREGRAWLDGTKLAAAPQPSPTTQAAESVPAVGYPPLPRVGAIGYASVVDIDSYAKTLTIGPHLPGVRDIALWTTDQMRAYVDAARAAQEGK